MTNLKFIGAFSILILAFVIVIFTALRTSQAQSLSQLSHSSIKLNKQELRQNYEASQTAYLDSKTIEYPLPYHGILPNHPLYWLKMIRDRMALIFTFGKQNKIDLLVFYGDKRLVSGQALIASGQETLGVSTITKAEKYLYKASQLVENEEQEKYLVRAYLKHKEIINDLNDNLQNERNRGILLNSLAINQSIIEGKFCDTLPQVEQQIEASKSAN